MTVATSSDRKEVHVRIKPRVLIRGAGDLATGVALRLHRCGFEVAMTEIAQPTPVRRTVAFAEAVYDGRTVVEGLAAVLVDRSRAAEARMSAGYVAVLVDPEAEVREVLLPDLVVDAVMAKENLGTTIKDAPAVVALGPGFGAGSDCHAVIETMRGHSLGRVIYEGQALPNTGVPGEIGGAGAERVFRAPADGVFEARRRIGDLVRQGETVATVAGIPIPATIDGVLRGLLRPGLKVSCGQKAGDVDPRARVEHCFAVSDKALAIAGGVLEAAGLLLGGFRVSNAEGRS